MRPSPTRTLAPLLAALLPGLAACGGGGEPAPVASPAAAEAEPEPPKAWLEAERREHDFGSVRPAAVVKTTFDAVAAGEEDLVIADVTHDCGCTEAELFVLGAGDERTPVELGRAYPPGTRFQLDATLSTKGKFGNQRQNLGVLPENGRGLESFVLLAGIESFLVPDPPDLRLEHVSPLSGVRQTVTLTSRDGEPFGLEVWRAILCEGISTALAPIDPDEDGRSAAWTLSVEVEPGSSDEVRSCKLIVATDVLNELADLDRDGTQPTHRHEYRIQAQVDPVMRPWPDRMNFGSLGAGESATERFVIRNADTDFDLTDLRVALVDRDDASQPFAQADACELDARPLDNGHDWEITLRIADFPTSGPFNGVVLVELNHPYQRGLAVPFAGVADGP